MRSERRCTEAGFSRPLRTAKRAAEDRRVRLVDTNRVLVGATLLEPQTLRTLDAIHVATTYRIRTVLAAFVSYDARQLAAAEALGLPVASPR
jgi:predicted nucleic acid-binding protein